MAWTETTRAHYRRDGLRYASDLTDREWAVVAPFLPALSRLGRPREVDLREIVNAILYILSVGCQWRALPKDFPSRSTVQGYFYRWRDDQTWHRMNDALVKLARQSLGRKDTASAGIIDSQSAPTTESGGPRGIDAGKRIKGRKRHIVTDTEGFLLAVRVHEANIQDPHGAVPLLRALRSRQPRLRLIFADRIYRGEQLRNAIADCGPWTSRCGSTARISWLVNSVRFARSSASCCRASVRWAWAADAGRGRSRSRWRTGRPRTRPCGAPTRSAAAGSARRAGRRRRSGSGS